MKGFDLLVYYPNKLGSVEPMLISKFYDMHTDTYNPVDTIEYIRCPGTLDNQTVVKRFARLYPVLPVYDLECNLIGVASPSTAGLCYLPLDSYAAYQLLHETGLYLGSVKVFVDTSKPYLESVGDFVADRTTRVNNETYLLKGFEVALGDKPLLAIPSVRFDMHGRINDIRGVDLYNFRVNKFFSINFRPPEGITDYNKVRDKIFNLERISDSDVIVLSTGKCPFRESDSAASERTLWAMTADSRVSDDVLFVNTPASEYKFICPQFPLQRIQFYEMTGTDKLSIYNPLAGAYLAIAESESPNRQINIYGEAQIGCLHVSAGLRRTVNLDVTAPLRVLLFNDTNGLSTFIANIRYCQCFNFRNAILKGDIRGDRQISEGTIKGGVLRDCVLHDFKQLNLMCDIDNALVENVNDFVFGLCSIADLTLNNVRNVHIVSADIKTLSLVDTSCTIGCDTGDAVVSVHKGTALRLDMFNKMRIRYCEDCDSDIFAFSSAYLYNSVQSYGLSFMMSDAKPEKSKSLTLDLTEIEAQDIVLHLGLTFSKEDVEFLLEDIKRYSSFYIFLTYMRYTSILVNPGTRLHIVFEPINQLEGTDAPVVELHEYSVDITKSDLELLEDEHKDTNLVPIFDGLANRVMNMLKNAGLVSLSLF